MVSLLGCSVFLAQKDWTVFIIDGLLEDILFLIQEFSIDSGLRKLCEIPLKFGTVFKDMQGVDFTTHFTPISDLLVFQLIIKSQFIDSLY